MLKHLFYVGVEGDGHVEQDLTLLYPPHKVLDAVLQLVGGLVDLLRVTLARLSQLLRRLQKLICVGVCVLSHAHKHHTYSQGYSTETYTAYTHIYTTILNTRHLVFTGTDEGFLKQHFSTECLSDQSAPYLSIYDLSVLFYTIYLYDLSIYLSIQSIYSIHLYDLSMIYLIYLLAPSTH